MTEPRTVRRLRSSISANLVRCFVQLSLGVLGLLPSVAHAEASWLTARGRLAPELRLEAWGGTSTAGVGFVLPDVNHPNAALSAELAYAFLDRTIELRATRAWQFSRTNFATGSASLGASMEVVPEGRFDLGIGPHAGLYLSLGGSRLTVDLGLQSGADVFFASRPRFPQRLQLSVNVRVSQFAIGLHARVGVDLFPTAPFVGRGEVALSFGWLRTSQPR